jgi:putative endonuclease
LRLKRAAEHRGRRSEWLAMFLLVLKGYRILGRRVRTRAGEIDVVARTPGGIVCFVEVKSRNSLREAQEALLLRQKTRIGRAAELFMAQRPWLAARGVRYDMIIVAARMWPKHVRDAWRPQGR